MGIVHKCPQYPCPLYSLTDLLTFYPQRGEKVNKLEALQVIRYIWTLRGWKKDLSPFLLCVFSISTWIGGWVGWHSRVIKPIVWWCSLAPPQDVKLFNGLFLERKELCRTHKTGFRLDSVSRWVWRNVAVEYAWLLSNHNNKSLKMSVVSFSQVSTEFHANLW